jgi:hypothetical protein
VLSPVRPSRSCARAGQSGIPVVGSAGINLNGRDEREQSFIADLLKVRALASVSPVSRRRTPRTGRPPVRWSTCELR